jgi:hypothetical protein
VVGWACSTHENYKDFGEISVLETVREHKHGKSFGRWKNTFKLDARGIV